MSWGWRRWGRPSSLGARYTGVTPLPRSAANQATAKAPGLGPNVRLVLFLGVLDFLCTSYLHAVFGDRVGRRRTGHMASRKGMN